jgi:hypothetical protein
MNHPETSISGSKYQSFLNFSNTLFIQLQNLSIIHNSLKIEAKSLFGGFDLYNHFFNQSIVNSSGNFQGFAISILSSNI